MGDEDVLRSSRQYFIDKLAQKAAEIRPLVQRISQYDQDLNENTDLLAIIVGDDASFTTGPGMAGTGIPTSGARPNLRPDEFTGKPYFEAAKSYLERIGHAVSMDELLDALRKGGSPVGGKTPKKTLYISLVRAREVVPIPGQIGFVGLRKWYPNLKQSSEKKAAAKKGKK
jgi:hypothetical protein